MLLPWVRLHALKDYLDMPLRAASFERVRVTFNLVPSLLDQIELYLDGGVDRHLELTQLPAERLDDGLRLEILDTFFAVHPPQMIRPYPRYWDLYNKMQMNMGRRDLLPALFTMSELRDIQVWSNLVWIDPVFRSEEPIRTLFSKQKNFTEEDKAGLVNWQLSLMSRIIPTYRDLLQQNRIEISFTPYYHPILPLLCDTDVAREALPGAKLPRKRFAHPEDAEQQIVMAQKRFRELFEQEMTGMWPSEGGVSEAAIELMARHGIRWAATDQEILQHSLLKEGRPAGELDHLSVYRFAGDVRVFFRDHDLSDRIGFAYSNWDTHRAVDDFIGRIKQLGLARADRLDETVVPVILDGENCWEYYPLDGSEFLDRLYRRLNDDPGIQMVTFSEAAAAVPSTELRRVYAGSWIKHNFRIWIGQEDDNAAWDLLGRTREALVTFEREHPDFDKHKTEAAWRQIYIAEGSDWCWWYGDEHRGPHNLQFDQIYRRHLGAVYEYLGLPIPRELQSPVHVGSEESYTLYPDAIVTAQIDGRITHFYEWSGAGYFDCLKALGATHRKDRFVSGMHFAYDHNRFYIRLDFHNKNSVKSHGELAFEFALFVPAPRLVTIMPARDGFSGLADGQYEYCLDDILEVAFERDFVWPGGYGPLSFTVALNVGGTRVEVWPENDPVQLVVPEKNKEMFWPT